MTYLGKSDYFLSNGNIVSTRACVCATICVLKYITKSINVIIIIMTNNQTDIFDVCDYDNLLKMNSFGTCCLI